MTAVAPESNPTPVTPEMLQAATNHLRALAETAGIPATDIRIKQGSRIQNWKPDASQDTVEITLQAPQFQNAPTAQVDDATTKLFEQLQADEALRRNGIFASPEKYLDHCKTEVAAWQEEIKALGVPLGNVDFTKMSLLDPNIANSQKPRFATQIIENADLTTIRINVPTNPDNLEAAAEEAKKIAAELEGNKEQMKQAAIAYIERKGAVGSKPLTQEQKDQFAKHEFSIKTQQQGKWTSVFIEIRSPEQVDVRDHPENKAKYKPEELTRTNMLMQIDDANRRAKLAGRLALFTGEKLQQPASYFMDVAGTENIKDVMTKMSTYLVSKKPEWQQRAADLLNENFLVSNEDWSLPAAQRSPRKQPVSAEVKPGSNELTITMRMPMGKADAMLAQLAQKSAQKEQAAPTTELPKTTADAPNTTEAAAIAAAASQPALSATTPEASASIAAAGATPEAVAAAAGNVTICPEGHAALSASGAAATPETAGAIAAGACIPIEKAPEPHIQPSSQGITLPNGATIPKGTVQSFLAKQAVGSMSERVANTPPTARSIA